MWQSGIIRGSAFCPPQKERQRGRKMDGENVRKGNIINNIDMDLMVGGKVSTPK